MKNFFKKNGYTLIEAIISVTIFTLLIGGVTTLFKNIFVRGKQQTIILSVADQGRSLLQNFTNELRNAGTGNDGSYQVVKADDQQIILYSNFDASATTTVRRIRYYIGTSSATTTLYKGVVTPTGSPLSYNLSNEVVRPVETGLASSGAKIFYYYDGNYDGTTTVPLTQPVNINNIRYVQMSLLLLKQDVKNATTTFTMTAGAGIRNLKSNLGN